MSRKKGQPKLVFEGGQVIDPKELLSTDGGRVFPIGQSPNNEMEYTDQYGCGEGEDQN